MNIIAYLALVSSVLSEDVRYQGLGSIQPEGEACNAWVMNLEGLLNLDSTLLDYDDEIDQFGKEEKERFIT